MSIATIRLLNEQFMANFYFSRDNQADLARRLCDEGHYRTQGTMAVPGVRNVGEDIAEEVFDLTNNPSRQQEREELYGQFRSVSVGDIINVDGEEFLCASVGWVRL